jgi:putative sigma-54 modulation protein
MKVHYTGRQEELTAAQQKKLEAKFSKLAKLLDLRGGEREAHVILTTERHLRRAEITVRMLDHPMVGVGTGADQYAALLEAIERLEKQVLKLRAKKRDTKRGPKEAWPQEAPALAEASSEEVGGRLVFRVDEHDSRKPMTLEEALLEMGPDRDYLVFRDAERDRISVLVRRRDGHFDLVEA